MVEESLIFGELLGHLSLIGIMALMIYYMIRRDDKRQELVDKRYEKLTETFIGRTIKYSESMIDVIDGLPKRQTEMVREASSIYLETIKIIIEELKLITSKVEDHVRTKDEFIEYIKSQQITLDKVVDKLDEKLDKAIDERINKVIDEKIDKALEQNGISKKEE